MRKNRITKLKNDLDLIVDSPTHMELMNTSFCKELYTREPHLQPDALVKQFDQKVIVDILYL
jgi:hypothetical protein